MKRTLQNAKLSLGRFDQRHVSLMLVVLTLILFVIGAGAPSTTGH